ncbi:hypothetical protein C8J56DRAFT_1019406, partial [Mycena floridula]
MVLSILRRFKRKQETEGATTVTGSPQDGILSHDDAAIGSWIQSMQGVTISGNVHGSMFSNNHVTIIPSPNANNDQDYIEFKVGDIILRPGEIHTRHIDHDLQSDGTLVSTGKIHEYNVEVVQSPRQFKIWRYERGAIESSAADALATHKLVPHNTPLEYQMVNNEGHLIVDRFQHQDHGSTWKPRFNRTWPTLLSAMAYKPEPIPRLNSRSESTMEMANQFKSGIFVQSHLSNYYNYLERICTAYCNSYCNVTFCTEHQSTGAKFHISTAPFQFRLDSPEHGMVVKTECLSGPRLRFAIPTSSLIHGFIIARKYSLVVADSMEASADSGQGSPSPFCIWASQAHHIIQAQGINSALVQTVVPYRATTSLHCFNRKSANQSNLPHPFMEHDMIHLFVDCGSGPCSWCWSTNPTAQKTIPHKDVEDALGLHIDIFTWVWHYSVPPQLYPILRQIHEACGFNPDSTEMAEYLGYPILEPVLETTVPAFEG